jgi:hypothetical protein
MAENVRDGYWAGPDVGPFVPSSDHDAAIAAKDAEIERLRAALEKIATVHCSLASGVCNQPYLCVTCIARAALATAETEVKP